MPKHKRDKLHSIRILAGDVVSMIPYYLRIDRPYQYSFFLALKYNPLKVEPKLPFLVS